ncbi:prolipoprotein diacylglyceryl transferase [Buchnera aphidicola (Nipponaphis monzeni)]|uniref:Phosphatidylglycerol--prolipoprotein diacylglyceryl transferase n=1 Tax=Buchnera aphidicola (Nipponaphis monzeni) TaxID=2495405 RepID=A0A455TAI1_9GAMM|nr:prolipoprotein diacylglyceryl transferase [Buchnera aphidicola]BBI01336.1 prolipoprotein diacylglyceryl transferase [Buchnera aphidicola (Nipponaphis monzeni)]
MNNKYVFVYQINPIIFSIGKINFYWYGLLYFLSIMFIFWKIHSFSHKRKYTILKKNEINTLFYNITIGILIGSRIGYIVFYNLLYYYHHNLNILKTWEGGMSFHGGLIGGIISILYFSKKSKKNFFQISDFIVPFIPIGIGTGRIGNFINGELWGRATLNAPISILFPTSITSDLLLISKYPQWQFVFDYYHAIPRHPSQLYELLLEGIILYFLLKIFNNKKKGLISAMFLIVYGLFRCFVELFREPDVQIGFFYFLTLGQILSIPMIIIGIVIIINIYFIK